VASVPRASDINSLNNINTAVAKIFRVSFGNDVDFIIIIIIYLLKKMTGLISLRILVAERRSRFFSKLHASVISVSNVIAIVL